jgi:isopentenyl-diphosphate delta-isomerase
VTTDLVVLLDEHDRPAGTAPRADVHSDSTPLHLAFSCYVRDGAGRLLVTRRALTKRTWPGVWTNSFCGHPRPGEEVPDAVHRYAARELGTSVHDVRCVLPSFRYRAVDASGVVENELCPVFVATAGADLRTTPSEVAELQWVPLDDVGTLVDTAPWAVSPWLVAQVRELRRAGLWEVLR